MASDYNMDSLVSKYIQLRDKEKEIKERHKAELAPIHELMAKLESVFLDHMSTHGMDSFATEHGTPYRVVQTSVAVQDWEAFFQWTLSCGQTGMLTRGANKAVVGQYLDATKSLPPGLNVSRAYTCNVRRS